MWFCDYKVNDSFRYKKMEAETSIFDLIADCQTLFEQELSELVEAAAPGVPLMGSAF